MARWDYTAELECTDRQVEVLRTISEFQRENGFPPTIRQLGERLGIRSTNGVNDHLEALALKGCVERMANSSRSTTLTHKARRLIGEESLELAASRALMALLRTQQRALGEVLDAEVGRAIDALRKAGVR